MKEKVSLIIVSFLVLILFPSLNSSVIGDTCKKFDIVVWNYSGKPIKVTGIRYYDYDVNRWRIEVFAIPRIIKHGDNKDFIHNLEHVGNDETKIKIIFKYGKSNWRGKYKFRSKKYFIYSEKFTCNDSMQQFLLLGDSSDIKEL